MPAPSTWPRPGPGARCGIVPTVSRRELFEPRFRQAERRVCAVRSESRPGSCGFTWAVLQADPRGGGTDCERPRRGRRGSPTEIGRGIDPSPSQRLRPAVPVGRWPGQADPLSHPRYRRELVPVRRWMRSAAQAEYAVDGVISPPGALLTRMDGPGGWTGESPRGNKGEEGRLYRGKSGGRHASMISCS